MNDWLKQRSNDLNWAKVNQRSKNIKAQKEQAAARVGSAGGFNLYARRKVKPKILWEVEQKEEINDKAVGGEEPCDQAPMKTSSNSNTTVGGNDDITPTLIPEVIHMVRMEQSASGMA